MASLRNKACDEVGLRFGFGTLQACDIDMFLLFTGQAYVTSISTRWLCTCRIPNKLWCGIERTTPWTSFPGALLLQTLSRAATPTAFTPSHTKRRKE